MEKKVYCVLKSEPVLACDPENCPFHRACMDERSYHRDDPKLHYKQYRPYVDGQYVTHEEKRILRKWVESGHSVYDSPGSPFIKNTSRDSFLETYRRDKKIMGMIHWQVISKQEDLREKMDRYCTMEEELRIVDDYADSLEYEMRALNDFLTEKGIAEECWQYVQSRVRVAIPFDRV
ncbi:MAG: hypothetical protein LUC41_03295 [Clostridiales bacterium]|nr:hypothetical protein [Clostridiales bacterium]